MKKKKYGFIISFVLCLSCMILAGSCKVNSRQYKPRKYLEYSKRTNRIKAKRVNDIQYRDAYKYDTEGARYKKHFRKMRKLKRKKHH